ncbi:hypothetical protein NDU88_011479 [Pleurodeles waltl]|uniref:Uncharacterized protein n=1 Tax=Pleurodeles waltl TaxID=8319 RepID=A0AAV7S1X9_PLEWA|nr:hypothetical protein NDU88_011479 [Pleurodeles waltl]
MFFRGTTQTHPASPRCASSTLHFQHPALPGEIGPAVTFPPENLTADEAVLLLYLDAGGPIAKSVADPPSPLEFFTRVNGAKGKRDWW